MTEPTITTLPDGTIEYRNADDQLHRLDGPALRRPDGYQQWWLNGQLHRLDGPAVARLDGYQAWYLNGKCHRADGPAVTASDGYQAWYLNGKCHRADGPAVTTSDGHQAWYLNGKLHRLDGPAVTAPDGLQEWYLNGKRMTQAEHAEARARFQGRAEIERLRAELEILRSALKMRVSNVSEDQILAAWAAWDDCHEAPQANDTMRAALEASHLVFLRRTSQIVEASLAALTDQTGGEV